MCVLHDWGDEECIQIMSKCREVVGKKALICVSDLPLPRLRMYSCSSDDRREEIQEEEDEGR